MSYSKLSRQCGKVCLFCVRPKLSTSPPLSSIAYTTSTLVEREVVEEPQGALAWLQKPRTVRRVEETVERAERADWRGSELGASHYFKMCFEICPFKVMSEIQASMV